MISFVYPFFLAGIAALALPVILHMMNREIPTRLVFPSIRFIRRAHLPREGRRQLQDLLVLLLRLLLLAAVVLAFARPRWRPKRADAPVSGRNTQTIILVDASASMAGWAGIETAKMRAAALLEQADDDVGLVLSSNRVVTSVLPAQSRSDVRKALDALDAELVPGQHTAGIEAALRAFSPQKERTLVIVSDFQQTDWQPGSSPVVPSDVTLRLLDVNPDRVDNAGITAATALPINDETLRVIVEARNFGSSPAKRILSLTVAGETFTQQLDIPPLQVRKAAFAIPKPDVSQGEVTLTPDEYPLDDSYRLWLGQFPAVKILAVAPLKQEPQKAEELFFLRKVLSIRDDATPVDFELETVEADFLFALNLDAFGAVLLLGAAGYFEEDEFALLQQYLANGGVVLCTPGVAVGHMFHGLRQHGLMSVRFLGMAGENVQRRQVFGLGWVKPESSLAVAFGDVDQTDLFLFPMYRYVRLEPLEDADVLLKTLDGDPALLARSTATGKLFVSAFGFDPSWSDLPMTGSFLPLVRELMAAAVPDDYGVKRLECGQSVPAAPDALDADAPGDSEDEVAADTSVPGVFVVGENPYEVNVSRRESVVDKVNLLDLEFSLTGRPQAAAADRAPAKGAADASDWRPLWPHCALAAAVLLLLEMLLTGLLDRRELAGRRLQA